MDIKARSERLKPLMSCAPNPLLRGEVHESLSSKFEGIQSLAAQVLAAWGDPESVEQLKTWFDNIEDREHGWSIRGVAAKAMAKCVTTSDTGWVLDRFFAASGVERIRFRVLVLALPWESVERRILKALESEAASDRRGGTLVLIWYEPEDLRTRLKVLAADIDPQVSRMARLNLRRTGLLGWLRRAT